MADAASPDIDLLDGAFYAGDPHPTYTWMREHAPVYFDAAHGVWGFASYAAVLGASKDPSTFSNAGGIRPDGFPLPMMIEMDDPAHWKRRKLVNRGFTPGRVRASEQEVRDKCDAIIDRVCERGECDFVRDIAAPLPMALIGDMLGVAPEDRDDLLRWSDDMVSSQSGSATEEQFLSAMHAMEEYTEFCTHAVAHAARSEAAIHELAARPMLGIVHVDHHRDRPGVRTDSARARERPGIAADGHHPRVRRDSPELVALVVVHGRVLAHPGIRFPRAVHVEICREQVDRGCLHACRPYCGACHRRRDGRHVVEDSSVREF